MKKLLVGIVTTTFVISLQSADKKQPERLTPREKQRIQELYKKVQPIHQCQLKKIIK